MPPPGTSIDGRIEAALAIEREQLTESFRQLKEATGEVLRAALDEERKTSRDELVAEVQRLFAVVTEMQCMLDVIKSMNRSERVKVFDTAAGTYPRSVN